MSWRGCPRCSTTSRWRRRSRTAPSSSPSIIRSHEARRMIPGEIRYGEGDVVINEGAQRLELSVVNNGDRPVQVGSHVHLPQGNAGLEFGRAARHGDPLDTPP